MGAPSDPGRVGDRAILGGLRIGDVRTVSELMERYRGLIELVLARVLDEMGVAIPADRGPIFRALRDGLTSDLPPLALEWQDGARLDYAVARVTRYLCEQYFYAPAVITKDFRGLELLERVHEALDALGTQSVTFLRSGLLGLRPEEIAVLLGSSVESVVADLRSAADRLAKVQIVSFHAGDPDGSSRGENAATIDAQRAWRGLLGVSTAVESVTLALRAEEDELTRLVADRADEIYRLIKRPLDRGRHPENVCEQSGEVAFFVDGSLPPTDRRRFAEHLFHCRRCLDAAALLTLDMSSAAFAARLEGVSETVALVATCIATHRSGVAEELATLALGSREPLGTALLRTARSATILGMGSIIVASESSRVVRLRTLPGSREAPLAVIEALIGGDVMEAQRALETIDEQHPARMRLALLVDGAGFDLDRARSRARSLLDRRAEGFEIGSIEPEHLVDAELILALPPARALPQDLVIARLRAALPRIAQAVFRASERLPR